jgi:hypothetical protein|tara:strand:- start:46 stop:690 length:645 start_codon:yes stop_codon:yes gene_type:complete
MSFKTKKYQVIRGALSKELSDFIFRYMMLQRDAVDWMMNNNKLNAYNPFIGTREDKQVPGAYSKYADWAMETLLLKMIPIMKKRTGLDLVPTYAYTRVYEKGNILRRHKDRPSCEISTTLHLGGDEWPIFLDPSGQTFVIDEYKQIHKPNAPKGVQVDLKQGDMLIYSGCELEHWREPFQGTVCSQVFLHYNHAKGPFAETNVLDRRPILGIPK